MNIKRYYIFLLDKEKGKEDAKLRFRIRWGQNIVAFNLGFRVDVSKWSIDTQRCKNGTTHGKNKVMASVINREINRYEEAAEKIFQQFEKEDKVPDKLTFKETFLKEVREIETQEKLSEETVFLKTYNTFTKEMGFQNSWTDATYKKFATLKNHLLAFNDKIAFSSLNEEGLNSFVAYLRDDVNLRNTTIKKQIGFLKWFLRWANAKGYANNRDFEIFAPKLKDTKKQVIFLEWNELMKVYNFKFPDNKKYLDRVRDVFCFCCFTSLRYSDVANLKWHNVYEDHIIITTVKTADRLTIELNEYSKAILEKYKNFSFPNNAVLPVITNQKMNEYIKEVGYVCEINTPINLTYYKGNERIDEVYPKYKLLGTHSGRRTFICNALMLGISAEVVMKWTGHSDYKSMKPYIDIADSTKQKAMNLFNKKGLDTTH